MTEVHDAHASEPPPQQSAVADASRDASPTPPISYGQGQAVVRPFPLWKVGLVAIGLVVVGLLATQVVSQGNSGKQVTIAPTEVMQVGGGTIVAGNGRLYRYKGSGEEAPRQGASYRCTLEDNALLENCEPTTDSTPAPAPTPAPATP